MESLMNNFGYTEAIPKVNLSNRDITRLLNDNYSPWLLGREALQLISVGINGYLKS